MKEAEINIKIKLGEDKIPEEITWQSSDGGSAGIQECKAFLLALWDGEQNNTFRIDLWTKEMKVDEMNFFFYQSLMTMADTFKRSTNNPEGAQKMKDFANELARDMGLIDKKAT